MAAKQTPIASTSTADYVLTWYACGQRLPAGAFDDRLQSGALKRVQEAMPNLVPTTYEAADAYLREEHKKPKGKRDLLREMCAMLPVGLPKDRKAHFVAHSTKTIFEIVDGMIILFPTIDLPPDTFGTSENIGFLDSKFLVFDPPAHTLQKGTILLSYFTKFGTDAPLDSSVDCMKVDTVPYA